KPAFAKCRRFGYGPDGRGEIEIYDHARFFAVTGHSLGAPRGVEDRQGALDELCASLWPPTPAPTPQGAPQAATGTSPANAARALAAMLRMSLRDQNDGSFRLYTAACRCVEHDLADI